MEKYFLRFYGTLGACRCVFVPNAILSTTVARNPCYLGQVCMKQREFSRRFRGFKLFNILFSVFFGVRFCSTEYPSNDDTMDKRATLREEASGKCSINSFSHGVMLLRKFV